MVSRTIDQVGQPARLIRCRTPSLLAACRSLARLAAKNRPSHRPAQLLQPIDPQDGWATQPLENPDQVRRDRGLPLAKKTARVIDQKKIVAQRKSRKHSFTHRVEVASILDRAQPQRLFEAPGSPRASDTSHLGRCQVGRTPLGRDVFRSLVDRGIRTALGYGIDPGSDRVEVDVHARGQESLFIKDCNTFEAFLEKSSPQRSPPCWPSAPEVP